MRRLPAEFEPHRISWLAWPHLEENWPGSSLQAAEAEFRAFVLAILESERVALLVRDADERERVADRFSGVDSSRLTLHEVPTDDAWLRDTAPLFVSDREPVAVSFRFDGYGGRYPSAKDVRVGGEIAARSGVRLERSTLTLEGGAIESDGCATLLVARRSLVCPRRNPAWSERSIELELERTLGARRVLWLDCELPGDDTDGHVDTYARFVAPGRVVVARPAAADHPAGPMLEKVRTELAGARDARGETLEIIDLPLPDPLPDPLGRSGRTLPASYANFYVTQRSVLVPTFDLPSDAAALDTLALLFPGREVRGLVARAIVLGQGLLHCLAQPQFDCSGAASRA